MKVLLLGLAIAMLPMLTLSQKSERDTQAQRVVYQGQALTPLSAEDLKTAVDYIELHVQMPKGARPLSDYDRYYAQKNGIVLALYSKPRLNGSSGPRFVRILGDGDHLPMIHDGGCSFIDVTFTPQTGELKARCHGEA